jgi:predicted amidohydrolase
MSKFLLLGMSLDQVIACVTTNAARVFEAFNDRGTLNVGAPADVAVLEIERKAWGDAGFARTDAMANSATALKALALF